MSTLLTPSDKSSHSVLISNRHCSDGCYTNCQSAPEFKEHESEYLKKKNYLSEFKSEAEKQTARENLGIPTEFNAESISYETEEDENIHNLKEALDSLFYTELEVEFNSTPSIAEIGDTIDYLTLSWKVNKKNVTVKIGDSIVPNYIAYIELSGPFTKDTTFLMEASDDKTTKLALASLKFYSAIYYGTQSNFSDFSNLDKKLQGNKATTITVNCLDEEYILIGIPYSYGVPSFFVGGFEGGFELILDDFYHTNGVRYRVYKSDNPSLGLTTINIK